MRLSLVSTGVLYLWTLPAVVLGDLPGIDTDARLTNQNLVTCGRVVAEEEGKYQAQIKAILLKSAANENDHTPILIVRYSDIVKLGVPPATLIGEGRKKRYRSLIVDGKFSLEEKNEVGEDGVPVGELPQRAEYITDVFTEEGQELVLDATTTGTYCVYIAYPLISTKKDWNPNIYVQFSNSFGKVTYGDYIRKQALPSFFTLTIILLVIMYQRSWTHLAAKYFFYRLLLCLINNLVQYVIIGNSTKDGYSMFSKAITTLTSRIVGLIHEHLTLLFALGYCTIYGNFKSFPRSWRITTLCSFVLTIGGCIFTALVPPPLRVENLDTTKFQFALKLTKLITLIIATQLQHAIPFILIILCIVFYFQTKNKVLEKGSTSSTTNNYNNWLIVNIRNTLLIERILPLILLLIQSTTKPAHPGFSPGTVARHVEIAAEMDEFYFARYLQFSETVWCILIELAVPFVGLLIWRRKNKNFKVVAKKAINNIKVKVGPTKCEKKENNDDTKITKEEEKKVENKRLAKSEGEHAERDTTIEVKTTT